MSLSIRRAQPADAGNLARFAARTFFETYAEYDKSSRGVLA